MYKIYNNKNKKSFKAKVLIYPSIILTKIMS